MDRLGSRRSRVLNSFESGAIQRNASPKGRSTRPTQKAVRAWVESLEIRRLLAADLSVAITGSATAPMVDNPVITQGASVSSDGTDPNPSNNSASQTVTVSTERDLAPTISGPTVAAAGTLVNYVLSVSNTGELPAGKDTVTFNIPPNAPLVSMGSSTFSITPEVAPGTTGPVTLEINPGLKPGQTATVSFLERIVPSAPDGSTIVPTATLERMTGVDHPSDNSTSLTTNVIAQADVAASITGPSVIVPGALASYTLKVTNNGPSDARNVNFSDALPPGMGFQSVLQTSGWGFGINFPVTRSIRSFSGYSPDLPAGASATFTLTGFVQSDLGATSLTDTLNVTTDTTDLNLSNNSASVTAPVHPQADLGVALSTSIARPVAGTGFSYTITLNKTGPSVAQNVVVSEVLAPGVVFSSFGSASTSGPYTASGPDVGANGTVTFQIPSVAPYGFYSFTVNVALPSNTPAGPLPSTVTVTSSTPDPNTANNTATDTFTQAATSADVSITDAPPMMFIDHGTTNSPPVLHPVFVIGQNNTWVIDVTNSGPSDAQNVTWSSAIPTGVMVESVSQVSGPAFTLTTPPDGTGSVNGNIATLAAGQTAEFDLVLAQNGIAAGDTVSDTATVTSDTADPDKYNNTSTATAVAYTPGDLAVSIQGPSISSAGTYVNYIIDITNDGQLLAGGATLNFVIPAGARFNLITDSSGFPTLPNLPYGITGPVSFTLPAGMVSGGEAKITLQLYIEPDVPNETTLAPTATLTGTPASDDPSNNTASVNTLVLAQGDLAVTQTGPSSVVPGATATYTFTIANNGPSYSQNVSFSDPLPAGMTFVSLTQTGEIFTLNPPPVGAGGTVTGSIATFRAGALATFTLVAMLDPSAGGTSLTNTVTATAATTDPNATNNSASVTSAISPQADLAVTETGPATVVPGTDVTYTFKITNNGPSDAQNASFSDPLPAGMQFISLTQNSGPAFTLNPPPMGSNGNVNGSIATLPAAATASFTLVALFNPWVTGTSLTNTVSTTSNTTDLNSGNNDASITSTITPLADLSVSIVSIPAVAGQNVIYTLTVNNSGPSDAQNVVLTQKLPDIFSYQSMARVYGPSSVFGPDGNGNVVIDIPTLAGISAASYRVTLTIPANTPAGSAPTTLSATSATTDTNLSNNVVTDTQSPVTTSADLSASVLAPSGGVIPSQNNTFSIQIINHGPSDAQNASWNSAVPAGMSLVSVTQSSGPTFVVTTPSGNAGTISGNIATLAAGQSVDFEVVYFADGAMLGDSVSSTVSVASATPDAVPANNNSTATAAVRHAADLAISLEAQPSASGDFYAGTDITYRLDVTNLGGAPASGAAITYNIPDNAPFSSFGDSSGFPTLPTIAAGATGPITFMLPAGMPYGGHAQIDIVEHVPPSVNYNTVLSPTASLSGLPSDDDPSNNTASASTTIHTMADLAITQTGPATVTGGTFANYEVTITNDGPSDSSNVTFRETVFPGNDAVVTLVVQDSGPTAMLGYGGASMFSLPVGASAAFTVPIVPDDEPPGTVLTAIATVAASDLDLNSANNIAQTNSTVDATPRSILAVPSGVVSSAGPVAAPSPIHGFGRTIDTTLAGFSGVVAQFIDAGPTATSSAALRFHVAINWGDGGLSVGTVTYDKASGRWNVSGAHRYKRKGAYTITVLVQDSAGRQGAITSHAIVRPVLVTPLTKQLM